MADSRTDPEGPDPGLAETLKVVRSDTNIPEAAAYLNDNPVVDTVDRLARARRQAEADPYEPTSGFASYSYNEQRKQSGLPERREGEPALVTEADQLTPAQRVFDAFSALHPTESGEAKPVPTDRQMASAILRVPLAAKTAEQQLAGPPPTSEAPYEEPGSKKKVSEPALNKLLGAAPPAARAYASTLMGDRSKIDESFFNEKELDVLRDSAERALAKGEKVIGYGDYAPGGEKGFSEGPGFGPGAGTHSALAALNDLPSSLSYTLGMARVHKEKDGTIVIKDKYDFNARPEKVQELKDKGTWAVLNMGMQGLIQNGLLGPLNLIGNLAAPEGKGRDVEIRIPPKEQR